MAILFSLSFAAFAWGFSADTQWAVDFWPTAFTVLAVVSVAESYANRRIGG